MKPRHFTQNRRRSQQQNHRLLEHRFKLLDIRYRWQKAFSGEEVLWEQARGAEVELREVHTLLGIDWGPWGDPWGLWNTIEPTPSNIERLIWILDEHMNAAPDSFWH